MKDQSFAKAFEELENITHAFEQGKFDLDEGLKQFERGLELAAQLKKKLAAVENKVDVIKKKFSAIGREEEKGRVQEEDGSLPF